MQQSSFSVLVLLAATAVVSAGGVQAADSPMKATNQKEAVPYCAPGDEKSACGLPSRVVIDMSKTKVQRTEAEWRALLTPEQFNVARKQGTEPPFRNEYWNNHEDGVYFTVGSDTPLFDSRDKFDSGTGWPSFYDVLPNAIGKKDDTALFSARTEVH